MTLGHAFPCSHPLYAVVADETGKPVFHRVHSMGMLQEGRDVCVLVGMIADEQRLDTAERLPAHVGYSLDTDPKPWVKKCKARSAELKAKAFR